MIINFTFSNFYSFAEETCVSFALGKRPKASYYDIDVSTPEALRLNKVVAVVGANGAGKTQFVRSLAFLSWFVVHSMKSSEPNSDILFHPHMLYADKPTHFEIEFIIEGRIYRYELALTKKAVLHEALYEKTSHLFSYIFVREKTDDGYHVKQKSHFGFAKKQAEGVRANVSLLSSAYMYDVPEASQFIDFFNSFTHNVNVASRRISDITEVMASAEYFYDNPSMNKAVSDLLCSWDLGLSAVELTKQEITTDGETRDIIIPFGVHTSDDGAFKLPLNFESSGTQSAYVLLSDLLPVLENGGVAVIDELDNDLHPLMLPAILDLFKFKETNPHDAQLLFSCHAVEVLNELAKHQVYLIEKNDLVSDAWRLDDMEGLRADDNLYAKYLSGALGGVPNL